MHTSKHTYGRKSLTPKTKKLHPSVDLTAMVNLSYLLIMFFMLQSFMKKPEHIDFSLPEHDTCGPDYPVCGGEIWRNLTLLLGENNKVVMYFGIAQSPLEEPKVFQIDSKEFSKEFNRINQYVLERVVSPEKEGLTVIIKPSDKCQYKNLISALDAVNLIKPRTFTVSHIINSDEQKLLEK